MPLVEMSIGDAGIAAVLGYVVVFVGLILLLIVVLIVGKIMVSMRQRQQAASPASTSSPAGPAAVPQGKAEPQRPAAPGSAGQIKLYDVPDKEAAMLMAIVADKMGKPLNELRFKSMKEVKRDEV